MIGDKFAVPGKDYSKLEGCLCSDRMNKTLILCLLAVSILPLPIVGAYHEPACSDFLAPPRHDATGEQHGDYYVRVTTAPVTIDVWQETNLIPGLQKTRWCGHQPDTPVAYLCVHKSCLVIYP
jgi:hypothetical protein